MRRNKANRALRLKAAGAGVYMEDIAREIGIAPSTLSCWMAEEVTEERRIRVEAALRAILDRDAPGETA